MDTRFEGLSNNTQEVKIYLFNDAILIASSNRLGKAILKEFALLVNVDIIRATLTTDIFSLRVTAKDRSAATLVFRGEAAEIQAFENAVQIEQALLIALVTPPLWETPQAFPSIPRPPTGKFLGNPESLMLEMLDEADYTEEKDAAMSNLQWATI